MATQNLKIEFNKETLATMYKKAEDNLQAILDSEDEEQATQDRKAKVAQFIVSRIGKEVWSERTELTGAQGEALLSAEDVATRIANLKNSPTE